MSSSFQQEKGQEAKATAKESSRDMTVMAAVGSIALSWYFFFVQGDRERGLFVGLWAPTLLTLSNYVSMAKVQEQMRTLMNPGSNIRESVQKIIGNQ